MADGDKRRPRRARTLVAVALIAGLATVGVTALAIDRSSPQPRVPEREGAKIYGRDLTRNGWPVLLGIYSPDGGLAEPAWRRCDPQCGPVIGREQVLQPGSTPAGVEYQLETTYRGKRTTARSPAWRGQVTNVSPPTFTGDPSVGVTLEPTAGTWRGGWDDDYSKVGMQACRTPTGGSCRAMNEASFTAGGGKDVVVNAGDVGWYVGAIETRASSAGSEPLIGSGLPTGPAQIVAAGPLRGPVTPVRPGALPMIELRASVEVDGRDELTLGTIRCPRRCDAEVYVRRGGNTFGTTSDTFEDEDDLKIKPQANAATTGPLDVIVRFGAYAISRSGQIVVED